MRAGKSRQVPRILFPLLLALGLAGCGEIGSGAEAFRAGDFARAERILKKVAQKWGRKAPTVKISKDRNTSVEQAVPQATHLLFVGWEAYTGSLFGQGRIDDGCKAVALAFRPVTIVVRKPRETHTLDPRQGDYWQAEVYSLRAWWDRFDCEERAGERPETLLD